MSERLMNRRQFLRSTAGLALEPLTQKLPGYGILSASEQASGSTPQAIESPPGLDNANLLNQWFYEVGLLKPDIQKAKAYLKRMNDENDPLGHATDELILAEQQVQSVLGQKFMPGGLIAPTGLTIVWLWAEVGESRYPERYMINWADNKAASKVGRKKYVGGKQLLQVAGAQLQDIYNLNGVSPWSAWTTLNQPDQFRKKINDIIYQSKDAPVEWNYQHAPESGLVARYLETRDDGVREIRQDLNLTPDLIAPNLNTFNSDLLVQFVTEMIMKDPKMTICMNMKGMQILGDTFSAMRNNKPTNWGRIYNRDFVQMLSNMELAILARREQLLEES